MKKFGLTTKKVLSVLLAAAMTMSLAACGGDGASTGDGDSAETTQQEQGGTEKTEGTADAGETTQDDGGEAAEEPEYDFGGRVFRIGSYYDMTPDPASNAVNAALAERIAYVEENYNCTIEFVNLEGDYINDYVTSVLAGDPVVDIGYAVTTTVLPALIEGGIAYPISDLNVIDFNDYKWRSDVVNAGYYKGKNYTIEGSRDPLWHLLEQDPVPAVRTARSV